MNRTILACCMILGLCTAFCSPPLAAAWSHPRRHTGQQKVPTAEAVNLQGVVQSITATHIEVIADKPTGADSKNAKSKKTPHGTWSVLLPHDTPIQVTGEATPDYLHHGIMVRFTAQGKGDGATELVHELTIVTAWTPEIAGTIAEEEADLNGRPLSVVSVELLRLQPTEG
jgi:hypothetical protein